MSDNSKIEWTDSTWTPIRARNLKTGKVGWYCEHATTGCIFCYAEGMNKRLGTGLPFKPGHRKDVEIFLDEKMLLAPLPSANACAAAAPSGSRCIRTAATASGSTTSSSIGMAI